MKSSRRQLLQLAAGTAALSTLSRSARALDYPTRPVTLIVPFPAGGTTDVALRALATATEKYLGQSIVVENRAGAAGTLGPANVAATAKPDGYTISQLPGTVFRQPFMTKTSFDPATDFTYIICLTGYTFGVVVRSDAPWKTFPELLAAAKANPSTITYGTPGAGTTLHITMEQIAKQQGVPSRAMLKPRQPFSAATLMRLQTPQAGLHRSTTASFGYWSPGAQREPKTGRTYPP